MENNKFSIVRTEKAGVFFCKVLDVTGNVVTIADARKLFFWKGAAAVEQIALEGVKNPTECKFTVTISQMQVFNPCQIIPCTDVAYECIKNVHVWKR